MSAANWERVDDAWNHCGRPAWLDDEGATCSKCQASMTWAEDQAGWVFHNLETGTVDGVGADSWLLDVDTLTADELRHLHDADSLGWFDAGAAEIVRARGVAMSEVLDAFAIVRRLDAAGLMGQVLDALAAEEGADEAERLCADCYDEEPADGWAEEAPGFRLCGDCSRVRQGVGADCWLVDLDALDDDGRRLLNDADDLGWFDSGAGWDCGECLQVQPAGADYVDDPRGFRVCDSCVMRLLGGES